MAPPKQDMAIQYQMMADLGSGRRDEITSSDPARDKTERSDRRVTKQQLEARRAVNLKGTSAAEKAAGEENAGKLAAWNTLPKEWGDNTELEDLPDILGGQAHRARLNRELSTTQDFGIAGNMDTMGVPGSQLIGGRASGDARNFISSSRLNPLVPSQGNSPLNGGARPTYGDPNYRPLDPAAEKDKAPQYSAKQKSNKKGSKRKADLQPPAHTPRGPRAGPLLTTNIGTRKFSTADLTPEQPNKAMRPLPSAFNRDKLADSSAFLAAANITNKNNEEFQKHVATNRQAEPGSKASKLASKKKEAVVRVEGSSPLTLGDHRVTYPPRVRENTSTAPDENIQPKDEGTDGLSSPKTLNSHIWDHSESAKSRQTTRSVPEPSRAAVGETDVTLAPEPAEIENHPQQAQQPNISEPPNSVADSLVDVEQPAPILPDATKGKGPMLDDLLDQENTEATSQQPLKPASPQPAQVIDQGDRIFYKGNWYILEGSQALPQALSKPAACKSIFSQISNYSTPCVMMSTNVPVSRSLIGDDEIVCGRLGRISVGKNADLQSSKWNSGATRSQASNESKEKGSSISSVARTLQFPMEDNITMLQKARRPPQGPQPPQSASFAPSLEGPIPKLQPTTNENQSSSAVDDLSSQMAGLRVSRRNKATPKSHDELDSQNLIEKQLAPTLEPLQKVSGTRPEPVSQGSDRPFIPQSEPASLSVQASTTGSQPLQAHDVKAARTNTNLPSTAKPEKLVKASEPSDSERYSTSLGAAVAYFQRLDAPQPGYSNAARIEDRAAHEAAIMRQSMGLLSNPSVTVPSRKPPTSTSPDPTPALSTAENALLGPQNEVTQVFASSPTGYGTQSRLKSRLRRKVQDYDLDSKSVSTRTEGSSRTNPLRAPLPVARHLEGTLEESPGPALASATPITSNIGGAAPTTRREPVVVNSNWAEVPSEDAIMNDTARLYTGKTNKKTEKGIEHSKYACTSTEDATMTDFAPPLANITNAKRRRTEALEEVITAETKPNESAETPSSAIPSKSALGESKWAKTQSSAVPTNPILAPTRPFSITPDLTLLHGPPRTPAVPPPAVATTRPANTFTNWGRSAAGSLGQSKWAK